MVGTPMYTDEQRRFVKYYKGEPYKLSNNQIVEELKRQWPSGRPKNRTAWQPAHVKYLLQKDSLLHEACKKPFDRSEYKEHLLPLSKTPPEAPGFGMAMHGGFMNDGQFAGGQPTHFANHGADLMTPVDGMGEAWPPNQHQQYSPQQSQYQIGIQNDTMGNGYGHQARLSSSPALQSSFQSAHKPQYGSQPSHPTQLTPSHGAQGVPQSYTQQMQPPTQYGQLQTPPSHVGTGEQHGIPTGIPSISQTYPQVEESHSHGGGIPVMSQQFPQMRPTNTGQSRLQTMQSHTPQTHYQMVGHQGGGGQVPYTPQTPPQMSAADIDQQRRQMAQLNTPTPLTQTPFSSGGSGYTVYGNNVAQPPILPPNFPLIAGPSRPGSQQAASHTPHSNQEVFPSGFQLGQPPQTTGARPIASTNPIPRLQEPKDPVFNQSTGMWENLPHLHWEQARDSNQLCDNCKNSSYSYCHQCKLHLDQICIICSNFQSQVTLCLKHAWNLEMSAWEKRESDRKAAMELASLNGANVHAPQSSNGPISQGGSPTPGSASQQPVASMSFLEVRQQQQAAHLPQQPIMRPASDMFSSASNTHQQQQLTPQYQERSAPLQAPIQRDTISSQSGPPPLLSQLDFLRPNFQSFLKAYQNANNVVISHENPITPHDRTQFEELCRQQYQQYRQRHAAAELAWRNRQNQNAFSSMVPSGEPSRKRGADSKTLVEKVAKHVRVDGSFTPTSTIPAVQTAAYSQAGGMISDFPPSHNSSAPYGSSPHANNAGSSQPPALMRPNSFDTATNSSQVVGLGWSSSYRNNNPNQINNPLQLSNAQVDVSPSAKQQNSFNRPQYNIAPQLNHSEVQTQSQQHALNKSQYSNRAKCSSFEEQQTQVESEQTAFNKPEPNFPSHNGNDTSFQGSESQLPESESQETTAFNELLLLNVPADTSNAPSSHEEGEEAEMFDIESFSVFPPENSDETLPFEHEPTIEVDDIDSLFEEEEEEEETEIASTPLPPVRAPLSSSNLEQFAASLPPEPTDPLSQSLLRASFNVIELSTSSPSPEELQSSQGKLTPYSSTTLESVATHPPSPRIVPKASNPANPLVNLYWGIMPIPKERIDTGDFSGSHTGDDQLPAPPNSDLHGVLGVPVPSSSPEPPENAPTMNKSGQMRVFVSGRELTHEEILSLDPQLRAEPEESFDPVSDEEKAAAELERGRISPFSRECERLWALKDREERVPDGSIFSRVLPEPHLRWDELKGGKDIVRPKVDNRSLEEKEAEAKARVMKQAAERDTVKWNWAEFSLESKDEDEVEVQKEEVDEMDKLTGRISLGARW